MKNIKNTIFTIMLFLTCISNTYADCKEELKNEFKKVEDEYKVTYEYNKNTQDYIVTFHYSESSNFSYSLDEKLFDMEHISDEGNDTIYKVKTPGVYKIEVIGFKDKCAETLKTIKLKLPKYNKYSEDPICKGIEEFVLCNPEYEKEIDYETFVSRVNTYKKKKTQSEKPEEKPIEEESKIIQYIKDNLGAIIIISSFVILLTITIVITAKSIKESRRLE